MVALREGMGLTYACSVSSNDVARISELLRKSENFRLECEKVCRAANMDMLKAHSDFVTNREFGKALEIKRMMAKVTTLVLWQGEGKREAVTSDKLAMTVFRLGGKDAATAWGMSYEEYTEYLFSNADVMELVGMYEKLK